MGKAFSRPGQALAASANDFEQPATLNLHDASIEEHLTLIDVPDVCSTEESDTETEEPPSDQRKRKAVPLAEDRDAKRVRITETVKSNFCYDDIATKEKGTAFKL